MLKSAANDKELNSFGLESLSEDFNGLVNENGTTAVEQIHGSIAMFGPSVDRVMGFLDNDRSAYAERLELVE